MLSRSGGSCRPKNLESDKLPIPVLNTGITWIMCNFILFKSIPDCSQQDFVEYQIVELGSVILQNINCPYLSEYWEVNYQNDLI